jgi:hypothetical protein
MNIAKNTMDIPIRGILAQRLGRVIGLTSIDGIKGAISQHLRALARDR